jgi:hypothetical protein
VPAVRDTVAAFIESEGHRADIAAADDCSDLAEIVFRTRGQTFSVTTSELDPRRFRISTAYEVPELLPELALTRDALADVEAEYPATRFVLAHDNTIVVATIDCEAESVGAFIDEFWRVVARLREAGATALERMVDRSESKAAADKFIRQFTQGQR